MGTRKYPVGTEKENQIKRQNKFIAEAYDRFTLKRANKSICRIQRTKLKRLHKQAYSRRYGRGSYSSKQTAG